MTKEIEIYFFCVETIFSIVCIKFIDLPCVFYITSNIHGQIHTMMLSRNFLFLYIFGYNIKV